MNTTIADISARIQKGLVITGWFPYEHIMVEKETDGSPTGHVLPPLVINEQTNNSFKIRRFQVRSVINGTVIPAELAFRMYMMVTNVFVAPREDIKAAQASELEPFMVDWVRHDTGGRGIVGRGCWARCLLG